LSNNKSTW